MIVRKYKNLLGFAVFLGFTHLGYQTLGAETLNQALIEAYKSNPNLIAQRAKVRAVDEQVSQAVAKWRPTVSLRGLYGTKKLNRKSSSGAKTDSTNQPQSLGIEVSQSIFRGYRTKAEMERAENRVMGSRGALIITEQEIMGEVIKSYLSVLRDSAVLALRENNIEVITQQLNATRDRFEVGDLTRTDFAQSESRLARAIADRASAKADLLKSRAGYLNVVGHEPQNLVQPKLPENLPNTRQETIDSAIINHPQVIAALYSEKAARSNIDLIKGKLLPTVSIDASISRKEDIVGSGVTDTTSEITARFSVPLYQSGAVYSGIREAKQIASQRVSEVALRKRDVARFARDSWENYRVAKARITSFEAAVRAQEVAFEGVKQEAKVGSRTILDVLDAEQELMDTLVNLVSAKRNLIVSGYSLLAATGQLTAKGLRLNVEIYDPSQNLMLVRDKYYGSNLE
ncbi:MAG: TolC family outer membrane protein [Alphaproteobacteria bacterium]